VTDLKHEYSLTYIRRTEELDYAEFTQLYDDLAAEGCARLEREGVSHTEMSFLRQIEMRYVGQSYELTLTVPAGELSQEKIAHVVEQFNDEHDRVYGYSSPGEPTEFVNLRLTAMGNISKPKHEEVEPLGPDGLNAALQGRRSVYFAEAGGLVDCPIYTRHKLGSGAALDGPAIVTEMDSTTVLHPGSQMKVDRYGNLLITPDKQGNTRRDGG
jgi:N-methylhydantoinase A